MEQYFFNVYEILMNEIYHDSVINYFKHSGRYLEIFNIFYNTLTTAEKHKIIQIFEQREQITRLKTILKKRIKLIDTNIELSNLKELEDYATMEDLTDIFSSLKT